MKKTLSFFLLTSFTLYGQDQESESDIKKISINDISQHAQYWVQQMPSLAQEEYNLLANLIYFDFLTHSYESLARATLIAIYSQTILMNKQLVNSEADAKKTAIDTSAKLQKLSSELLPLRAYSSKSLKACLD